MVKDKEDNTRKDKPKGVVVPTDDKRKVRKWVWIMMAIILTVGLCVVVGFLVKINIERMEEERQQAEAVAEQEMINDTYAMYEDQGAEEVLKFYKEYIESAKNEKEKLHRLRNGIEDLNFVCGWDCSDEIINYIHELAAITDDETILSGMCIYEDLYVDYDPIAICKGILEGENG